MPQRHRLYLFVSCLLLTGPTAAEDLPANAAAAQSQSVPQLSASAWEAMAAQEWGRAIDLWSALLAAKPDDETALSDRGLAYAELGQFDLSLADIHRAVQIAPKSAGAWNSLCWIRILADQVAQARPACEKAAQLDPEDMASTVNLGHTYLLAGDRQGAWAWYEKTVPLIESEDALKQGPLNDFDIFIRKGWQVELSKQSRAWFVAKGNAWLERKAPLNALIAQAQAAKRAGSYGKAAELWERSLPLVADLYGDTDRYFGNALGRLADSYTYLGQYARAEPLYVRALAIAEKAQGPEHPSTGTSLSKLALLYKEMGQYARAEPLLVSALAIGEKTLSPEHPDTGRRLSNLALLYQAMGQYVRAEPLLFRALAIAEKVQGPEHPDTARSLNNLAMLYRSMGQYARAEPLFVRALAIHEKTLGLEHPSTGTGLNNLASLYWTTGQYARAEPLFVRALAIHEKTLGLKHPSTGTSLNNLAGLYRDIGRRKDAQPLYDRAYRIALNAGAPRLAWTVQGNLSRFHAKTAPSLAIF